VWFGGNGRVCGKARAIEIDHVSDAYFGFRPALPPFYEGCAFEAMIMDRWILPLY
jgi:hypothetical protein